MRSVAVSVRLCARGATHDTGSDRYFSYLTGTASTHFHFILARGWYTLSHSLVSHSRATIALTQTREQVDHSTQGPPPPRRSSSAELLSFLLLVSGYAGAMSVRLLSDCKRNCSPRRTACIAVAQHASLAMARHSRELLVAVQRTGVV